MCLWAKNKGFGGWGNVSFWLRKQRFGLGKGLFPGGKKKRLQERLSEP